MNTVRLGPEYITNPGNAIPISGGSIYIGLPDTDPTVVANQKTVYALQEDTTTIAIPQPISTSAGGVPIYDGSPVTLLVDGKYSMAVKDSLGVQKYYVPDSTDEAIGNTFQYPNASAVDQGGTVNSVV